MVDLSLDDETRMIVKAVGDFVEQEVVPVQEKYREALRSSRKRLTDEGHIRPELLEEANRIRKASAEKGFYGMHMPEEVGGGDVSRVGMLRAFQEVYKRGLGFTFAVLAAIEGPSRMLLALDEDQKERYLDPLMRGEKTSCFALTEPGAGSDVRSIRTRAEKDGEEWVLNGTKTFVTNGPYADFAQVFAVTDPDAPSYGGITTFLIDTDNPGLQQSPPQDTISSDGLQCEFHLQDCRVPEENVLGEPGEGFFHAMQNIGDTRVQLGGICLGLARYCLDKTIPYVNQREAFGRPISKFQGVTFPLADAKMHLTAAEQLALLTAWKIDQGEDAMEETSMTKLYCTEMLWDTADACVQAHGGVGVAKETDLENVLRYSRVMRIYEGTSEIQRATIAKSMGM
jgi:alkylation response protein AidB-like acyl-CoA dehydrogenase